MSLSIKGAEIAVGSVLLSNEDIAREYLNEDSNELSREYIIDSLEKVGKGKRYRCDNGENTLTLGAEACDKLLDKHDLKGEDIDMIIFASQYPEFTLPTQALALHRHIRGKDDCITFDLTCNCLGTLIAMDVANRYAKDLNGSIKRVILVGADYWSHRLRKEDLIVYGGAGDGACAVLLEYTDEENTGVLDSVSKTVSLEAYGCLYPECGNSSIENYSGDVLKTSWTSHDTLLSINAVKDSLNTILDKHNLSADDIDWFCGSQFAKPFFYDIGEACGVSESKCIYVGDKYGYTGTSSPLFSLNQGLKDGRIKKGDLVFIATVGVGFTVCSTLVRI